MINISSRQLRIFVSAAKHLNFTRAAKEVHISPPAVSMQIKEIELQVNAPLFIKEGRKLELSSTGEYFLNQARHILQILNGIQVLQKNYLLKMMLLIFIQ